MKKYKSIGKLLAVSFLTAIIASACTEDAMELKSMKTLQSVGCAR